MSLLKQTMDLGHRDGIEPVTEKRDDALIYGPFSAHDSREQARYGRRHVHHDAWAVGDPAVLDISAPLLPHAQTVLTKDGIVIPEATHLQIDEKVDGEEN